jgi:hypothetical protein
MQFNDAGSGPDQLRSYGLHFVGDPPSVSLTIAGEQPTVQVTRLNGGVTLRAALGTSGPRQIDRLAEAGLGTPGDTSFAFEGSRLVATRTLIEPTLGAMYDAIFDLAKSTCMLSRFLAQFEPDGAPVAPPPSLPSPAAGPPPAPRAAAPPPPAAAAPPPPAAAPPPRPAPASAPWRATHRVGAQGASAYASPGDAQPVGRLDPWLDVMVIEESQSGWAHVVCSNTWSTWIDRRALQPTQ